MISFDLDDEISFLLVESIKDELDQDEEMEDEDFEITYYRNQISHEQFNRIYKITSFILESIFPFHNFEKEEYEEDGKEYIKIRTSDEVGIFHTCFVEMLFSHNDDYIIKPRTCGCSEVYDRLNLLLPSLLSLDIFKIWICIQSQDYLPEEFKDRFESLLKMYVGSNFVESMVHIGYLAEQITRKIYLNKYPDKPNEEVRSENWNRLLKRLQNEKDDHLSNMLHF